MKKVLIIATGIALVLGLTSCVSNDDLSGMPDDLGMFQSAADDKPVYELLNEKVGPTSCNTLATTIGACTIVVDKDTSWKDIKSVKGADVEVVEYLGEKCLRVTSNYNTEVRVAFVLDKPTSLKGYKNLKFSIAGFEGVPGTYNCGLLYTDTNNNGERKASFYLSDSKKDAWTDVSANLVSSEQWGNNFNDSRTLYCIQFWTSATKAIYIKGLSLTK
ncbi:MAG: hypothetical protein GX677_05550 [Treponema sp.]|jgi:outer membrane lipoprotein SlyB|nr:hypothetical protein [Treponema sp.]